MKTNCTFLAFFLQIGFLFAANPPTASSWTGATGGTWTDDTKWTPGVAPNAPGAIAQLTNGVSYATPSIVNSTLDATVGNITFDYGTAYTVSGTKNLTLQATSTSGITQITITTTVGTGAHVISCPVVLANPLTVSQGSTSSFTISGIISELPAGQIITLSGTGTLVFSSAANTYTGGTIISSGTLSVNLDNQLGSGSGGVTIVNGTLQFTNAAVLSSARNYLLTGTATINTSGAGSVTLAPSPAVISGAGSLEKTGSGTLILGGTNTYQGGTTISAGTLSISSDANLGLSTGSLSIGTATLVTTAGITSSRSGTFIGAPSVIDTGGNTDTFSGNFSGVGALTIQGGGTVIFSGTNSYTGGTTLTAAGTTLQGNTSSIQRSVALGAGTFLTFNQSSTGTYSGALSGTGTLTKTGTGTVRFTGSSTGFTGPTNINQGTLNVNGSLINSSLTTIASGATLSGSGSVGATTNSGTIDPGNGVSVGTLTVSGALTLNASSHVNVDIAPLSADRIAVTGAATINGSLSITPTPGFYGFSASYTILTSAGLVLAPGFGPITSTNAGFVPTVTYSATSVTLNLQILEPFAVFPFSNRNTEAVGNNIDAIFAAGQLSTDLRNVFDSLVGQSNAVINAAMDQMHPAQFSAFTEMQSEVGGQLISLFHRLPYLPCACANPTRLWIEPFGNSLTLKHHGIQIGSQSNTGGIAVGLDGELRDNWILGFGGAWSDTYLEWHDHRGHGIVNGFYGGAYTDVQFDQFYMGASILAGMDFYETSRHIDFVTTNRYAKADFNGLDIMAQVATAYLFGAPQAFFYPYANIDLLYLQHHMIHESGAQGLDLTVQSRADITLRSEMGLGLQVQDTNMAQTMCISPQVSLGWVNLCPIQREDYTSTFEGASIPFTVHGWDETWNLFNVDFGLSFAWCSVALTFQYNVEFSPDSETILFNQHGNVRLDWKW